MRQIDNYISEKLHLDKNIKVTNWEEKEWVIYLPYTRINYPKEYFICNDKKNQLNVYVFSIQELKDLYMNNPGKYPDYYMSKLNKKYFNSILDNLLTDSNYEPINDKKLIDNTENSYVSKFIDNKYINKFG